MYRPSSHPPTTAWAKHLDQVRRSHDWSAEKLFEVVQEPLGLSPKSRATFLPLLWDREPTERQAAVLAGLFGLPPALPEEPSAEVVDLELRRLALMERQAVAAERQADAMEALLRLFSGATTATGLVPRLAAALDSWTPTPSEDPRRAPTRHEQAG